MSETSHESCPKPDESGLINPDVLLEALRLRRQTQSASQIVEQANAAISKYREANPPDDSVTPDYNQPYPF